MSQERRKEKPSTSKEDFNESESSSSSEETFDNLRNKLIEFINDRHNFADPKVRDYLLITERYMDKVTDITEQMFSEHGSFKKDNKRLKKEIIHLKQANDELKRNNIDLNKETTDLKKAKESLSTTIEELKERIKMLNTKISQATFALRPIEEGKTWDKEKYPSFISKEQLQEALKQAWEERSSSSYFKKTPRKKDTESDIESDSDKPRTASKSNLDLPEYSPVPIENTTKPGELLTNRQYKALNEREKKLFEKVRLCLGQWPNGEPCIWGEPTYSHNTSSHWIRNHRNALDKHKYMTEAWMRKDTFKMRRSASQEQSKKMKDLKDESWKKMQYNYDKQRSQDLVKKYLSGIGEEEEESDKSDTERQPIPSSSKRSKPWPKRSPQKRKEHPPTPTISIFKKMRTSLKRAPSPSSSESSIEEVPPPKKHLPKEPKEVETAQLEESGPVHDDTEYPLTQRNPSSLSIPPTPGADLMEKEDPSIDLSKELSASKDQEDD